MKDDVAPKPSTGRLFLTVFPSIMLPMFLAVVDQTIVATALPAIVASLGGVERVSWVVSPTSLPAPSPRPSTASCATSTAAGA